MASARQRREPKGNGSERSILRAATERAARKYDPDIDDKLKRQVPASTLQQIDFADDGGLIWFANAHKLSCKGNTDWKVYCLTCRAIDARLMIDIPFDDEHDYRNPTPGKVGHPSDATTTFLAQMLQAWGLSQPRIAEILGSSEGAIKKRLKRNRAK